ncbi:MAG: amino acid adenylation domain-containing protein [Flavobacteriales bacterium]|jgi:amino acid adenylation domain-containing protein|nr:amino acid adenylation domain-containing protein [Flavobacteriales bacterium]
MSDHDPISLFLRAAAAYPERPALAVAGTTWTYAELHDRSDRLAAGLLDAGAQGRRVAFVARRDGPWAYAAVLGILKAGGSCVPLHPDGPGDRWQLMLERCEAQVGLVQEPGAGPEPDLMAANGAMRWLTGRQAPLSAPLPARVPRPEDEAYVMFTSGSTGGPKGVGVSRGNLAAYLAHLPPMYPFGPDDRFTQLFALPFDLSMHDMFVCWASGACLCVPPVDGGLRAAAWARDEGITVWFSVPSLAGVMRRMRALSPGSLPALRFAFFCGEALPWELVNDWQRAAPHARIINLYGPTEATIAITAHEVRPDAMETTGLVPIGRPIGTDRAEVLPMDGLPHGEGELVLCGPQVTTGYINAPPATERAFVRLPGRDGLWYRTGDHVRQGPDGVLHYVGRIDHQVKVLGHRVEPGEVDEALMRALDGGNAVTVAAVVHGTARLFSFIDVPADVNALMERLRAELPAPFVPERITVLDQLPRNANGKWDRPRLMQIAHEG